ADPGAKLRIPARRVDRRLRIRVRATETRRTRRYIGRRIDRGDGAMKLRPFGQVFNESVATMDLQNVCVLDPAAPTLLAPTDKAHFDHVVFGGILGDNPPRGRTKVLNTVKNAQFRNLGSMQMSTDTAVLVAKRILDGTPFAKLVFKDTLVIPTGEGEEVELPYRYLVENGTPVLPEGLVEKLKKDEF
ncbi:MAG: SAM-dependent methyltransferase, partial [Nanoarchaeota archaeon]